MFASLLAVLCSAAPKVDARLTTGTEWDSNARRTLDTEADLLFRALGDVGLTLQLSEAHRLFGGYVLGGKRFFDVSDEDLLIQDLSLGSDHRLGSIDLGTSLRLRMSRVRRAARDYGLVAAGMSIGFSPVDFLEFRVRGGTTWVGLDSYPELSHAAPLGGVDVELAPTQRLRLRGSFEASRRYYEGAALQRVELPGLEEPIVTYSRCDGLDGIGPPGCSPFLRRDTELALSLRLSYRASFFLAADAAARFNQSNSELEDIDRYRFGLQGTFPLPLALMLNVLGAIELDRGESRSEEQVLLVDDDRARNRLDFALSRPLSEVVSLEARYSLYTNQLSTDTESFVRQTIYLGVAVETSSGN